MPAIRQRRGTIMSDVQFLRGRAEVYRRMAGSTPNRKTATEFLRLAGDCEEHAAALEKMLPQVQISIRKHPIAPRKTRRQQPVLRSA
jgi:hypothetical protein